MSTSPFENVVLFTDQTSSASISVTSTGSITVSGGTYKIEPTVTVTGFGNKDVTYARTGGNGTADKWVIGADGTVTCNETTANKTCIITVTSAWDSNATATVTLTSASA